jgi:hypothetical protein
MNSKIFAFWLLAFFFSFSASAQVEDSTTTEKVVVTLNNGKEYVGVIISDDGREILLNTESIGKLYINKTSILKIKAFEETDIEKFDGDYRTSGPFTTRYYFTTNSLPIKKNEDYAMVHLYGPEVHFSLNDRFSLGVMSTWIASPFVLAAKYTIPTKNEKLNFGLGTLGGTSGYLNTFRGYGALHWGMVTFGDRMQNITLSAGYSYAQSGFEQETPIPGVYTTTIDQWGYETYPTIPFTESTGPFVKAPVVSIAGITKVGKKASFFFDSMVFFYSSDAKNNRVDHYYDNITGQLSNITVTEGEEGNGTLVIAMPGMRFQQKENTAFQFALAGITRIADGQVMAFPIPMCSWFFKF